jgi:hypothetical protein
VIIWDQLCDLCYLRKRNQVYANGEKSRAGSYDMHGSKVTTPYYVLLK